MLFRSKMRETLSRICRLLMKGTMKYKNQNEKVRLNPQTIETAARETAGNFFEVEEVRTQDKTPRSSKSVKDI